MSCAISRKKIYFCLIYFDFHGKNIIFIGDEHDKTKESSECLKHLTQQAVVLQKKMNEIYTGKSKTATLPPIQIQAPSMTSVLDMLNIINGILFVQINPRDIENLKNEFEKRQQTTTAGSASPPPDTEVVESKSISGEEENAEEITTATVTEVPIKELSAEPAISSSSVNEEVEA